MAGVNIPPRPPTRRRFKDELKGDGKNKEECAQQHVDSDLGNTEPLTTNQGKGNIHKNLISNRSKF